jgi:hypothetical protein
MNPTELLRGVGLPAALFLAVATGAAAQQGTALPGDEAVALPVTINPGMCGEGGDLAAAPVFALGVLGPAADEDPSLPEADEVRGLQLSPPVLTLEEPIDATFDDLLGDAHAVVVASGAEGEGQGYVACGQLGGVVADDGQLAVGLRPLSDEHYFGVAVFEDAGRASEIAEGQLLATVYLFQDRGPLGPLGADDGEGTPTP